MSALRGGVSALIAGASLPSTATQARSAGALLVSFRAPEDCNRKNSVVIRARNRVRVVAVRNAAPRPTSEAAADAARAESAAVVSKIASVGLVLGGAVLAVGLGLLRFGRPALAAEKAAAPSTLSASLNADGEVEVREVAGAAADPATGNGGAEPSGDYEPAFGEGADLTSDHAEIVLRSYLDMHPDDRKALQALLFLRMKKGEVSAALPVLAKLIQLDPDNVEWKYVKAQVDELSGDLLQARQGYEEILQSRPFSARAWQGMSVVMHKAGAGEEILQLVTDALKQAVDAGQSNEALNLRMLLGQLHTIQGDLEKAMGLYDSVIHEEPTDYRPYLCQGLVYSLIGEDKEAEQCFQKYRKFCPKDFPQRGFLDELLLTAKTESKKMGKQMKQEEELKSKGQKVPKEMQQPLSSGRPLEEGPTRVPSTDDPIRGASGKDDTKTAP